MNSVYFLESLSVREGYGRKLFVLTHLLQEFYQVDLRDDIPVFSFRQQEAHVCYTKRAIYQPSEASQDVCDILSDFL